MIINTDNVIKVGDNVICNACYDMRFVYPLDCDGNNGIWAVRKIESSPFNPFDITLTLGDYYNPDNDNVWQAKAHELGSTLFKDVSNDISKKAKEDDAE